MGVMSQMVPDESEIFSISGPLNLTVVDWRNLNHRRSVAASLVQGVYVQERDRQKNRVGPRSLAHPWWVFFNFQLHERLVDDSDGSVFGAVYQFNRNNNLVHNPAPRYVIAFRGTLLKKATGIGDLKLDWKLAGHKLHQSSRFQRAMDAVQSTVAKAGSAESIWLAGHSLGAAIALLAGKNMVKNGCYIETYLFNPPFISIPVEQSRSQICKHRIRLAKSVVTAGLAAAVNDSKRRHQKENSFAALAGWTPYLFLNPWDRICNEYIGYFKHREMMETIGLGALERVAAQNSVVSLILGDRKRDSEPTHLLPSANLTINSYSSVRNPIKAHGITLWLNPDIPCQFEHHQAPP